ncbi:polysaccharide biosynthesis/export family protein [bacterium]|nr:polysaccharide biosynthesis/export family protein [bacterium]
MCAQQQSHVTETVAEQTQPLPLEQRARVTYDAYILGPGDSIQIEVLDLPELSGTFSIGPDGTMYLPRLRALYVEGLTIEELRIFITKQLRSYVIEPELYVRPIRYRPIRVYIGGEVKRPGYYTLSGTELDRLSASDVQLNLSAGITTTNSRPGLNQLPITPTTGTNEISTLVPVLPTVFDAIRTAQGITPYSNLATVEVIRRKPLTSGGGRIRAKLNLLSLITEGDETQNIRLFDGDMVSVSKSPEVIRDQILKAGQTNLTPQFVQVYVNGRVEQPGAVILPQGSSLVQAIDLAGGPKVIHGKVEFIRFTHEGEIDRRIFGLKSNAPANDYRNPVLMAGDIIRLRETPLSKSIAVLDELTSPVVAAYSLFSLFNRF